MTKFYRTEAARLIDRWCRTQGVSQAELSRRVGRSHAWLSSLINGHRCYPEFVDLRRIADVTGIPFEALAADREMTAKQMVCPGLYMDTVRDFVASGAETPEGRPLGASWRREILRHIDRLPEWLGRPLDRIPADPRYLRRALDQRHPRTLGVSRRTWQKARSALATALGIARVVPCEGMPVRTLGPVWHGLYEAAKAHDAARGLKVTYYATRLSRFIRYCQAHGIEPGAVDAAAIADYAAFVDQYDLGATDLARHRRETLAAWNYCVQHVPGWPPNTVDKASRETLRLSLEAFSAAFRAELEEYERTGGVRDADRFDPRVVGYDAAMEARHAAERATTLGAGCPRPKPHRPLAATTAKRHIDVLRLMASVLVRRGWDPARIRAVADIATPEAAAELMRDLDARGAPEDASTRSTYVSILRSVARRWCPHAGESGADAPGKFAALEDSVRVPRHAMRPKERKAVEHFLSDDKEMARLVQLPLKIVQEVEGERRRTGQVTLRMALRVQCAALLVILFSLPIRRTTLARTRCENITWAAYGGGLIYWPPEDVKQRKPQLAEFSAWKGAILRLYLMQYRPILASDVDAPWLFPGRQAPNAACHADPARLGINLRRLILDEFGVQVPAHLWRKILGGYCFRRTKDEGVVRALLGHSGKSKVTELYVDGLRTLGASETLDQLMHERLVEAGVLPAAPAEAA